MLVDAVWQAKVAGILAITSISRVSSMLTKPMAFHVGDLSKAGSRPVLSFTQYHSQSHIEATALTGCLQAAPYGGTL